MRAFMYGTYIQWKMDWRDKGILIAYYVVPLVFFGFMGMIFTSIDPNNKNTLIQSMTVFGVTMGAFIGASSPLTELYGGEIKKSYKVGGVPLWTGVVNNFLSAFCHLLLMSMVIFFVAPKAFGAKVPENLPLYFASLVLFVCVCISVGSALGLAVKSMSRLTVLSQFLFMPSVMISGIMFPATMLPKVLQHVGKVFPATWGMKAISRFEGGLFLPLVIMLVLALALCGILLWRTSKE